MRLTDAVLQPCLYHPSTGLSLDPARDFALPLHECEARLKALRSSLDRQQQLLWANNGPAVLVWLQGPDCSGKDGVIRNCLRGLNPQGVRVSGFAKPTEQQRQENFLERFRQQLPLPGMLTVFNRTPYESIVSDLADGYIDDAQAAGRLQQMLTFEAQLAQQNIHLIKIYLHISKDEQKRRLQQRVAKPEKHWKISVADLVGYQHFDAIQSNWNHTFKNSSTVSYPWHIVPANNKSLRNLLFCSLLAQTLETLALQWPQPELPFTLDDLNTL